MKFQINITTGINCESPLDNFNPGKGLDVVGVVRDEIDIPDFPAKNVYVQNTCSWSNNTSCMLQHLEVFKKEVDGTYNDVPIIEQVPQFLSNSNITIHVSPGFLSKFYEMHFDISYTKKPYQGDYYFPFIKYFIDRRNFVKQINEVEVSYKFNKLDFLQEWVYAGCPDYWNCDKDDIIKKQKAHILKKEKFEANQEVIKERDRKEKEA